MPSANDRTAKTDSLHTISLAGGCFWGLEAFLKQLPGVRGTEVGYANGATCNPTYAEVCHRGTGHAETVKVTYDPQVLPTDVLLRGFFSVIDPTSVNRQGNDVGAQYRSGVYWDDPTDEAVVRAALAELQTSYRGSVATEVGPIRGFYPAEDYHQDYLDKNPMPETFLVRVKDLSKIRHVVNTVNDIEGVEQTKAPYDFASVLVQIRNTFTLIGGAVLIALVVVSIVIVSNSIRTSVFARRNEISIMRYVGATSGFIKAPFFVEGMFIGILAGAAAWGLTWLIYDSVFALFSADLTVWQMFGFYGLTPFGDIMWYVLAVNCAAGALLGAVGTVFSTGKYLKV